MIRSIGVHILDAPYQIDKEYTYYSEIDEIELGSFVIVPFGFGNIPKIALVTSIGGGDGDFFKLKEVDRVISEKIALDEEMMGLCKFLTDRCLCSVGDAVRRFIPASAFENIEEMILYKSDPDMPLTESQSEILGFIKKRSPVKAEKLKNEFGDVSHVISKLLRLGAIERATTLRPSRDASYKIAFPVENASQLELVRPRTPASYKEIYTIVVETEGIPVKELENAGFKREHILGVERRGLIRTEEREILRNHYDEFEGGGELPKLNEEQKRVFDGLSELMLDEEPHGALLYGVTGSGKRALSSPFAKRRWTRAKRRSFSFPR